MVGAGSMAPICFVPAIPSFHEDRILKAAPVLTSPLLQKPFRLEQNRSAVRFEVAYERSVGILVAEMLEQNVCLDKALQEFEKQFLRTALRRSGGNQSKSARLLHGVAHIKNRLHPSTAGTSPEDFGSPSFHMRLP
jgi:hypothetical protein